MFNKILELINLFYLKSFVTIGSGTFVSVNAELKGSNISIGDGCRILKRAKLDTSSNPSRPDRARMTNQGTIKIGNNVVLKDYSFLITYDGFIKMGDRCSVNSFTMVYGHGGVTIGNDVLIASHCVIVSSNHKLEDVNIPIREQGFTSKGIFIDDDVWIGSSVTILDGVRVGRGCVIAAGSVVNSDLISFGVYAGVPAKLVKMRSGKNLSTI